MMVESIILCTTTTIYYTTYHTILYYILYGSCSTCTNLTSGPCVSASATGHVHTRPQALPRSLVTSFHGISPYLGHGLRPSTASALTSVTGRVLQLPQALPRSRATSIHGLGPYFVFGWRAGRHHSIVQYRGPQGHGSATCRRPGRRPTTCGLSGTQAGAGRACHHLSSTSMSYSQTPQRMMCPSRVVPLVTRLLVIASMSSSLPHSVDGNNIYSTCTSQYFRSHLAQA